MQSRQFNKYRFNKANKYESKEADLISYIPILTGGLIFLGAVRLIYYYSYFGINIVSYLEFSEIITSFLDRTITITTILLFLFAWFYKSQLKEKDNEIDLRELSTRNWYLLIIIIVIVIAASLYLAIKLTHIDTFIRQLFLLLLLPAALVVLMFYKLYTKHSLKYVRQLAFISMCLLISLCLIDFIAWGEYEDVAKNQKYLGTAITLNKEVYKEESSHIIVCDSSNFYIGKTTNYIFIYHKKDKMATIYPMSTVIKIDLKVKPSQL